MLPVSLFTAKNHCDLVLKSLYVMSKNVSLTTVKLLKQIVIGAKNTEDGSIEEDTEIKG